MGTKNSDLKELSRKAEALSKSERKNILLDLREVDLHDNLKSLFEYMTPEYSVEKTHGANEFGKDLILHKDVPWGTDAIGIIVHNGNIKGRTLGDIDKINSQINQAFSHAANLKEKIEPVRISKALIILNGDFSRQAKDRIKSENEDYKLEYLDIAWLIEKFSKYYPQVFFEGKVIDFLQKEIQNLEACSLFEKIGKNLSECYVDPLIGTFNIPKKLDEKSIIQIINSQKFNLSKFKSVLDKNKKIILIGDPGSGKTLTLKKICLEKFKKASNNAISGKNKSRIKIPLFIKASDFQGINSFKELIKNKFIDNKISTKFEIDSLMIDGLDEVLPEKRNTIIEHAAKISGEKNLTLIITSRKINLLSNPPTGYQVYELLPFEFGQAVQLFSKLIKDKKLLSSLKDGLKNIQDKLIMTPLSLILLIELVENYKEVPASITELYKRYTDLIFGRLDKEKGIEVLFDYIIKKKFISELTYKEFYVKKRLEVPLEDFEKFLEKYAQKYGWDRKELEKFIKEIERVGLIGIENNVYFRHRTFLDFFIAHNIFSNRENIKDLDALISELHYSDLWEDVAFFYVGHKREISKKTLDIIFSKEGDDILIILNKLLVGRLLQAAWHSDNETKFHGMVEAIKYSPQFRKKIEKITALSKKRKFPTFFLDFLVIMFSEYSFSSIFLFDISKSVIENIIQNPDKDSPLMLMSLMAAHFSQFEKNEKENLINQILDLSSKYHSVEDQARTILTLLIIEKKSADKALKKSLEKKLEKLLKKYPELNKKILPPKKKGFR